MKKKRSAFLKVVLVLMASFAVFIVVAFSIAAQMFNEAVAAGDLSPPETLWAGLETNGGTDWDTEPPPTQTPPPTPSPSAPPRPFPEWFNRLTTLPPDWIYEVDELPDWFYDLPAMPAWFYEIPRVPLWFYSITEIPDWFYPPEGEEDPDWMEIGEFPEISDLKTGEPGRLPDDGEDPENTGEPGDSEEPGGIEEPVDVEVPEPEPDPEPEPPEYPFDIEIYPFIYELDGLDSLLASSVPFGLITDGAVRLDALNADIRLTRDDEDFAYSLGDQIIVDGNYLVFLEGGDAVFSFRIITVPVNDFTEYTAPAGHLIQSVRLDGAPEIALNAERYAIGQDGTYLFSIADSETEETFSTVSITVDTTPPALTFSGWEIGEPRTRGPVQYYTDEDDIRINVEIDGRPYYAEQLNTLTEDGSYTITATDAAGNVVVYTFRLASGMNASAIWVIILVIVLLGALAVFLVRNRNKARVR